MFFENNPFTSVRGHSDLNGLQKIREVPAFDRADGEREEINAQVVLRHAGGNQYIFHFCGIDDFAEYADSFA